jgi:predicted nucleotidyltransferase component of viral defense system
MKPITRQDILAHQTVVPWPDQGQVEQDLLLCQAMAALFDDRFLSSQIAMRGGTLLHKVHLVPAARYSEDIDLVAVGTRPGTHISAAIRRVLADVLGEPVDSDLMKIGLAIRNLFKPSSIRRETYLVPSMMKRGQPLEICVETNVTERKTHRAVVEIPFSFPFRDKTVQAYIKGFDIHEMLATKMRALFQRKRGRDLFDLYWALTKSPTPVKPREIIASFKYYMDLEGSKAGRDEFISKLEDHIKDREFCSDTKLLLRSDISYDPQVAGNYLISHLLKLLPK